MIFSVSFPTNWNELMWYHYLAIGGGALVILALLLWFTPLSRLKMPAIVTGIVGGLGVGAALGAAAVIAMIAYGVEMDRKSAYEGDEVQVGTPGGPGGGKKGGPGGGKKGAFGGKKGNPGGGQKGGPGTGSAAGRGPSSKAQLASLVAKLDVLTHRPLSVKLDDEQKKKVREALQKLDEEKDLSDDQAKAKLDDLQKILTEEQRKTLDDAGFRWTGQGGAAGGQTPANPFSEGESKQHLKSLLEAK